MNRSLAAIALCTVISGLCGCAVQGRPFERISAPPKNAIIYVYRPYSYAGSLLRPKVTCNGESAVIGPGGYHAFVVPAGHVVCSVAEESTDQVEIHAEPGVDYIKEEIGWGLWRGHPHLNPMDADTAHDEIAECCVREQ